MATIHLGRAFLTCIAKIEYPRLTSISLLVLGRNHHHNSTMLYAVLSEGVRCGFFILTRSPEARGGLRSDFAEPDTEDFSVLAVSYATSSSFAARSAFGNGTP